MPHIGPTLRTLRILSGLSLAEVARKAALDERTVQRTEQGDGGAPEVLAALTGVYGVDPALLKSQDVVGLDETATLFLFSGDTRDLAAHDLSIAGLALHRARTGARSPQGRDGVRTRLERMPSSPAGPLPRDAARQGYALARDLRAALGDDPANAIDLTDVLRRLGIVASSARLTSSTLRAISVLDRDRAAAAIVLNNYAKNLRSDLRRVAIAHEICHLVYDSVGPDTCVLALDRLTEQGSNPDLRESRARGFAAELLLPAAGLREHLGPPTHLMSEPEARQLVDKARMIYGTPWEITVNHLHNLGFHGLGPAQYWTLPTASRPDMPAPTDTVFDPLDDATALVTADAARGAAREIRQAILASWKTEADRLVSAFQDEARTAPMRAAIELVTELDRAFTKGRTGLVRAVLERLTPDDVNDDAMVGLLGNLRRPCELFGADLVDPYRVLVARTLDALKRTWRWSDEDLEGARAALT